MPSARSIRNCPVVYASLLRKHSAAGFVHVVAALVKLWQHEDGIVAEAVKAVEGAMMSMQRIPSTLFASCYSCLIYTTLCQSSSISGERLKRKRWWGLVQCGGILDGFTVVGILYTCIIILSEFFTAIVDSCLIFKHIDLNDVRGCEIVQATVALVKALQSATARLNAS